MRRREGPASLPSENAHTTFATMSGWHLVIYLGDGDVITRHTPAQRPDLRRPYVTRGAGPKVDVDAPRSNSNTAQLRRRWAR